MTQPEQPRPLRVLVACEFSGIVRDAFIAAGHDAVSCDLLPSERPGPHIEWDAIETAWKGGPWDLMIAHPPCTHLAVSGARWFAEKRDEQDAALQFVRRLMLAPIPRIAIENPVSIISSRIRKPDQIIQPWMFGHGETKATCLWLKGLPKLVPTDVVEGRTPRVHHASPGPDRWKERSRTLPGIAAAMAAQWGGSDDPALYVLQRDQGCVGWGRFPGDCIGRLTLDHVRASGALGRKSRTTPDNLATLCIGHHEWKTNHGREARPILLTYLSKFYGGTE